MDKHIHIFFTGGIVSFRSPEKRWKNSCSCPCLCFGFTFFSVSTWVIEILEVNLTFSSYFAVQVRDAQGELSFQTMVLIWISNDMDIFLLALSLTEGCFYKWKAQVKAATGFWISLLRLLGCAAPEAWSAECPSSVEQGAVAVACPVAASVDTSQNCSPGWNFSSHHRSHTSQWLAHTRISDSRYLLHKRGCANRRNYFLSFLCT